MKPWYTVAWAQGCNRKQTRAVQDATCKQQDASTRYNLGSFSRHAVGCTANLPVFLNLGSTFLCVYSHRPKLDDGKKRRKIDVGLAVKYFDLITKAINKIMICFTIFFVRC